MNNNRLELLKTTLKRIGNFDNSTFEGRLILQKTVYLLQVFGLKLGYDFEWYVYGPYCKHLADDGYAIKDVENVKTFKFIDDEFENSFNKFISFVGKNKNDPKWLELIASIDFLRRIMPGENKVNIIKIMCSKQTYFREKEIETAWRYLSECSEMRRV